MVEQIDRGQVNTSAAEVYQEFFVPALFQEWTGRVVDAAHVKLGQRVLDVACGTGVLARTVEGRVGSAGTVIGLDINDGMLAVAERITPNITWRKGTAEDLPFDDASFDGVVSQFGLMFFEDRTKAIQEMMRVLKPGGHLAVAVWDTLDNTPGYVAMVELLQRLFGTEAANGLRAPYVLGDTQQLAALFNEAGVANVEIATHEGTASFPSIEQWVYTDIKGWVLADMLDDVQVQTLIQHAKQDLKQFVVDDGSVAFSAPAHIVAAAKA